MECTCHTFQSCHLFLGICVDSMDVTEAVNNAVINVDVKVIF